MTEEQDTEAEKPKPHFCSAKSTVPPSSGKAILLIHLLAAARIGSSARASKTVFTQRDRT